MNKQFKGWTTRGYLPHFDERNIYQFITFRLFDSLPIGVIEQLKEYKSSNKYNQIKDKEYLELCKKINYFEDNGYGSCFLKNKQNKLIVQEKLISDAHNNYELVEYKVMPNHVHVLIYVLNSTNLSTIVRRWKSVTAQRINKSLNRTGKFWMPGYFDTYIRNDEHLNHVIEYIRNN